MKSILITLAIYSIIVSKISSNLNTIEEENVNNQEFSKKQKNLEAKLGKASRQRNFLFIFV